MSIEQEEPRRTPDGSAESGAAVAGSSDGIPGSDLPPLQPDVAPPGPSPRPPSSPSAVGPADAPAVLPDFRLLAKIGEGGFGSVWLAQNHHSADAVAIKFIPPQNRQIELAGLQMLRQRVREGQDHLLWTEYIGEANGFIYCVMDLADPVVEGPLFADRYEALTLLRYMKQQGRLDLADALAVATSMAKGLAFLQSAGLRHGDIKPANVLRVRGRWKLADYGMMGGLEAKARGGTKAYLPPEGPHGERADQFAFGIVLHEMALGHRPTKDAVATWPSSRLGLGLQRIYARVTDPNPVKRYAHFKELVSELEAIQNAGAPSSRAGAGSACPHCGHSVGSQEEFCGQCGVDLWRPCPFCEHRGSTTQRFCTQCRGPVLGYLTVREELERVEAMLSEGRHREALQQVQGPLKDLGAEFDRDLGRLVIGDSGRRRRSEAVRHEVSVKLSRLAAVAQELTNIDGQIAAAHASLDPQSLRELLRRTTELVPKSRHYASLHREIPKLEARLALRQTLGIFGNPDRAPQQHPINRLQGAIAAIRREMPTEPEALAEAQQIVQVLEAEVAARIRRRCEQAARWHLQEGRPLEALRWWRRAEARGTADDAMQREIARLAGDLRQQLLPGMVTEGTGLLSRAGGHRSLRRLARNIAAIDPEHALVKTLRPEWMRRRRIDLLRRLSSRAADSAARSDFASTSPMLTLAYRIAGRDETLRARVVELDNGLGARLRAIEKLRAAEDSAVTVGDFAAASEAVRRAIEIAPQAPDLAAHLDEYQSRLRTAAATRRRRRMILAAIVPLVAGLLGVALLDAWSWWSSRRSIQQANLQTMAAIAAEDRGFSPLLLGGLLPDPYGDVEQRWRELWRERFASVSAVGGDPPLMAEAVAELLRMRSSGRPGIGSWAEEQWLLLIDPRGSAGPSSLPPPLIAAVVEVLAVGDAPAPWWQRLVAKGSPSTSMSPPSTFADWRTLQAQLEAVASRGGAVPVETLRGWMTAIDAAISKWSTTRADLRRAIEEEVIRELRSTPTRRWDWRLLHDQSALKWSKIDEQDASEEPWRLPKDLQASGRVELTLSDGVSIPLRLARLEDGRLMLVAEAQIDLARWTSVMGESAEWPNIPRSSAEEFRGRIEARLREIHETGGLVYLGLTFAPAIPRREEWVAWRDSCDDPNAVRPYEWVADEDQGRVQAVIVGPDVRQGELRRRSSSGDQDTGLRLFLLERVAGTE